MKKNNNNNGRYRSNNNYNNNNNYSNQIFSLNYKFDSISPAGKCSGTALDLIKRYNELAKEALGNADYVEAESFRQFAEHYRKIVTEINEHKAQRFGNEGQPQPQQNQANIVPEAENTAAQAPIAQQAPVAAPAPAPAPALAPKRSFKVIEINAADAEKPVSEVAQARSRAPRKPKTEAAAL